MLEPGATVFGREWLRNPVAPAIEEGLTSAGARRWQMADLLKPIGVGASAKAVVETTERNPLLS
jgi:hypothetical protein